MIGAASMISGLAGPGRLCRRDLAVAAGLFVATLALRLLFLLRSQDTAWPHSVLYEGDAPVWVQWASMLAAGQPFEDDLPFRTPGVAFLLGWLGMISPPFTGAKVLWCAMSAGTVAALHLIVARWFGRLAAIVAALLTAISFGSFAMATSLNNEVPYILLVLGLVGLSPSWAQRPSGGRSLVIGLMHGASMLLRAEHVVLLAMLVAWSAFVALRRGARPPRVLIQGAMVVAMALLACLPWMLRSHAAVHRFNRLAPTIVFDRAQPPWTPGAIAMFETLPGFAQGSNYAYLSDLARRGRWPEVDETAVRTFFLERWGSIPEPIPEWSIVSFKGPLDFALSNDLRGDGGFSRAALADAESNEPLFSLARPSHANLVNHGFEVGWKSIRSDPARWLVLVGEKMRRFVDGITLGLFPSDWPHGAPHVRHAIDVAVPLRGDAPWWNTLVLLGVGVGVIVALRTPMGGVLVTVLLYRALVIIAFYGYARHGASIGPILFALVGVAVQSCAARISRSERIAASMLVARRVGFAGVMLLLVVAGLSAWNPPVWFAKPLVPGGQIIAAPQWHPDAFEAVDGIQLEPLPGVHR
jgi:hypothetical protein